MADTTPDPAAAARADRPLQGEDIPWAPRLRVMVAWLALIVFVALILVVRLPLSGRSRWMSAT